MNDIAVRVTHACMHLGQRVEVGTTLRLSPLEAAQLVGNCKATLERASDAGALSQAERDDVGRVLRKAGHRVNGTPPDPWQRVA